MPRNAILSLALVGAAAVCVHQATHSLIASSESSPGADAASSQSHIHKIGTIDIDTVETSPVVFNDKLYRFESIRPDYHGNDTGAGYFQLIDVATGEATSAFAQGHVLGCAYAEEGTMYVFGRPAGDYSKINVFVSTDLVHWEEHNVLDLPGWEMYNTSVCKADGRYVMAFEVGAPADVVGKWFTARFAESDDLLKWTVLPDPAVYTKEKYSACPTIRWSDGWFYVSYLEALSDRYATYMVRSEDLATWEVSPRNPVVTFDDRDKAIASDRLTREQVGNIQGALNRNSSDLDYTEFDGQVVLYYSWGDQAGNEFLAKAFYDGTLDEFFAYYFPTDDTTP